MWENSRTLFVIPGADSAQMLYGYLCCCRILEDEKMKRIFLMLFVLMLYVSSGMAMELELAAVREKTHPTILADEEMAAAFSAAANGANSLSVGSAGLLYGDEMGILDAVVRGDVALGQVSVRTLAQRVPTLDVFSLPYLINGTDHLQAVLFGVTGDSLKGIIEEKMPEVKVLGFYNCGGRCFYSRKQVASPFDMPGTTFCAEQTEAMVHFLTAMGAKHQWLARHTVYSALFQGVIDGAENDLISLVYLGDYDPARYVLLDYHTFAPDVLLVSKAVYDRLDESAQTALLQAAKNAEMLEWEIAAKQEAEALDKLHEMGCSFSYMDNGVREAFIRMVREPANELGGKSVYEMADSRNSELVKEIQKMGESYPPQDNP